MASTWTQFFPPKPVFTEDNIGDLEGKVYFISGANSGLGAELTRILYSKNAKVYLACRSEKKAHEAIWKVKNAVPLSRGQLIFLPLDQADLNSVNTAAQTFLKKEPRLDVLFNNAGVMTGGDAHRVKKTVQGHELGLGVNCIAAVLLTSLLHPILAATARREPRGAVRIVWMASFATVQFAPHERGIDMDNLDYHIPKPGLDRYGISKAGVWLLGVECARRYFGKDGIVSVPINPGNAFTSLPRHQGCFMQILSHLVTYKPIFGTYTQLFAAFSNAVINADWTAEWVIPWGRLAPLRADLPPATKVKDHDGNGNAKEFWDWCEQQARSFL